MRFSNITFDGRGAGGTGAGLISIKTARGHPGVVDGVVWEHVRGRDMAGGIQLYAYHGERAGAGVPRSSGGAEEAEEPQVSATVRNVLIRDVRARAPDALRPIVAGPHTPLRRRPVADCRAAGERLRAGGVCHRWPAQRAYRRPGAGGYSHRWREPRARLRLRARCADAAGTRVVDRVTPPRRQMRRKGGIVTSGRRARGTREAARRAPCATSSRRRRRGASQRRAPPLCARSVRARESGVPCSACAQLAA